MRCRHNVLCIASKQRHWFPFPSSQDCTGLLIQPGWWWGGGGRYHGNDIAQGTTVTTFESYSKQKFQKAELWKANWVVFWGFFCCFFLTLRLCGRSGCVHLGLLRWLFWRRRQRRRRLWWRRLWRQGRRRLLLLGRWGSTRLSDHQWRGLIFAVLGQSRSLARVREEHVAKSRRDPKSDFFSF